MKRLLLIPLLSAVICAVQAQPIEFKDYFLDKTMRFDFYHAGDAASQEYLLDEIREEPYWAGSKTSLTDDTNYGMQLFRIVDKASGREIYSRGYNTLFNEWQTTPEAQRVRKAMPESVVFPYPKAECTIEIYAKELSTGKWHKKFAYDINPESIHIRPFTPSCQTMDVVYSGRPEHCVDIVLLAEGFTEAEKAKFEKACSDFAEALFSYEPFASLRTKFNIRAVWSPSRQSGVSLPGEHVWRDSTLGACFDTFDSERYQMIEDFQRLRDFAAHVPYEYIYVLSNTPKYGGGGIFNFYGISSANHPTRTGKVYVHEFGHLLLGLGDEYVEEASSFDSLYPLDVEPWEANLTTLVDFESKPWSRMIDAKTPVPTPVNEKKPDLVGVYEGGGYTAKGVYRPWVNCMMNNLHTIDEFCPVCRRAISDYVEFLCR